MNLVKRLSFNDMSIILMVAAVVIQLAVVGKLAQDPGNVMQPTATYERLTTKASPLQIVSYAVAVLGPISWVVSLCGKEKAMHTLPVFLFAFYIGSLFM